MTDEIKLPGDLIAVPSEFMGGYGIFERNGELVASIAGRLEQVQKHVRIEPLNARYAGDVGDVVVARVDEAHTASQRWFLNIGAGQRGVLHLASAQLADRELSIRNDTDARAMAAQYTEGDVLCTEVQRVGSDGLVNLHTRSNKYGKLENGLMVSVPSTLVQRMPSHWGVISCLVSLEIEEGESRRNVIESGVGGGPRKEVFLCLGVNGGCWVGAPPPSDQSESLNYRKSLASNYEIVDPTTRTAISRVRNCLLLLAEYFAKLTPEIIRKAADLSVMLNIPVPDINSSERNSKILIAEVLAEK